MFIGKNILAIAAHPDDLEFSVIGTLLKFRNFCGRLVCYIATQGGENDSSTGMDRIVESRKALSLLNPDKVYWKYRTGVEYSNFPILVNEIEQIVIAHDINMVLTPSPRDTHQDHRLISKITVSALRRAKADILYYPLLSSTLNFRPTVFVDITDFYELKKQALKCHASQADKYYMQDSFLETFNSDSYASLRGLGYSERFEVESCFF